MKVAQFISCSLLSDAGAVAGKYAWIKQHKAEFTVDSMCRFMQVSRSAYYAWL
ncbi:MAG: hypothetical protein ACXWC7_20060 [Chitinophagaceae bacterium]